MRAYRIAELAARPKPSRIVVAESMFVAVRTFARCQIVLIGGHIVNATREDPAHFACVKGGPNEGRHFIAWPVGREFTP